MARKDSVFETPRTPSLTSEQMLENLVNKRAMQKQNLTAIIEAHKAEESVPDFTATMESTMRGAEAELQRTATLENMTYQRGTKNIAKTRLGLKQKIITEGTEFLRGKIIGELIYESYWLDDEVKDATTDQIIESITDTLGYIEENFSDSKVAESKQSVLLKNLNILIEQTVKKAADRICMECEEEDSIYPEFDLTDAEEDELDEKLVDLGRDEVVDLIKSKVAQVVQDEKEKGQARADMFREIDELSQDTTDDQMEEEPTEAEEATIAGIRSGEIVFEGANWDTLKIYFNGLRTRASRYCKEGNHLYKQGKFKEASEKYTACKDIMTDVEKRLADIDDTLGSTILSFWVSYFTSFIPLIDSINTRGDFANIGSVIAAAQKTNNWNSVRIVIIANVHKVIEYCDIMINRCNARVNEDAGRANKQYKYSLEGMVTQFSTNERYIAGLMESGVDVNLFEDPSWNEFKSYVSMTCKLIQTTLNGVNRDHMTDESAEKLCKAKCLIEDLEAKLNNVPENVPGDVKEFVMAMVNLIYTAVPADEVIISRFGNPTGSPDIKSSIPAVDIMTVSWTDLWVNIKTNLTMVKSYCDDQKDGQVVTDKDLNNSDCPVTGRNSLSQLIAQAQTRILTKNIGGSLFEAMMLGKISECSRTAMESNLGISDDTMENAAMIEALLDYTVFETLDTIGLYKFRTNDINVAKRFYMQPISESNIMSGGRNKMGMKKIRINTKKMKKKKNPIIVGKFDQS